MSRSNTILPISFSLILSISQFISCRFHRQEWWRTRPGNGVRSESAKQTDVVWVHIQPELSVPIHSENRVPVLCVRTRGRAGSGTGQTGVPSIWHTQSAYQRTRVRPVDFITISAEIVRKFITFKRIIFFFFLLYTTVFSFSRSFDSIRLTHYTKILKRFQNITNNKNQ